MFASPAFHPSSEAQAPIAPPCALGDLDFGELYSDNLRLLVGIAVRKFQVPEVDAEALAHEVFLSYLKRKNEIRDLHPWLIGAICHASRYFWRQHGHRTEQLDQSMATLRPDPASTEICDVLPAQLAVREILDTTAYTLGVWAVNAAGPSPVATVPAGPFRPAQQQIQGFDPVPPLSPRRNRILPEDF